MAMRNENRTPAELVEAGWTTESLIKTVGEVVDGGLNTLSGQVTWISQDDELAVGLSGVVLPAVRAGLGYTVEKPQEPMMAVDVHQRLTGTQDPSAELNKMMVDRLFEILCEKGLMPEMPRGFKMGVATASPAVPEPTAPMTTRPTVRESSPLPRGLFDRMERNRHARVAGYAHFVEEE